MLITTVGKRVKKEGANIEAQERTDNFIFIDKTEYICNELSAGEVIFQISAQNHL